MPFSLRHNINLLKVFAGFAAPIYVQFSVSKLCNLSCRMCSVVPSRRGEPELDMGQIDRLADVLKEMRVGLIVLTGGEPLLRKDIVEVVAAFFRRGITVRLQSNGLLFERSLLQRLRKAGLDGMTVSLHSLSPRTMDEMMNVPRALERVLEALCLYAEVFPSNRYVGGINTVVTRANLGEIPRLIRFATAIGLTIALIPVHLAANDPFIAQSDRDRLLFSPADAGMLGHVFEEARALKREGCRLYNTDRFLRESVPFLTHGAVNWKCESPLLYFSISPSGTFLPCVDLLSPGGYSMLAPDFLPSWRNGDIGREIRARVHACRGCLYPCYPELSYLLHSKLMFVRRVLDYRRLSAPAQPLTMERVRQALQDLQVAM